MINFEERDLIIRAKNYDNEALKELINKHSGLIYDLATNLVPTCETLEIDDLYQEGALGLIAAIERYDLNSSAKLSTYAYKYIKGFMLRAMKNTDRIIRYPKSTIEKIEKIRKNIEKLSNELTRKADYNEILQNTDITQEQLNEYLVLSQKIARLEDIKFGYNSTAEGEYIDLYYELPDDYDLEKTTIDKILADSVYNSSLLKHLGLVVSKVHISSALQRILLIILLYSLSLNILNTYIILLFFISI